MQLRIRILQMKTTSLTRSFGMGTYLVVAFAGLSILATLIIAQLAGNIAAQQLKAGIGQNLAELAYQTMDKLDRGMFERFREVRLLAARSDLANPRVSIGEKRELLERMQRTYPDYAWLGLTDTNGRVVVAAHKVLEGADVSQRPWYRNAYKDVHLSDVHDALLLAKLLPHQDNEPKRFFDIAYPYKSATGKIAGIFGVHLSWKWASEVKQSVFRPLSAHSHVDALIVSSDSLVLLGPPALVGRRLSLPSLTAAAANASGFVTERWADGNEYLVGYSHSQGYRSYPGMGWTVLVRKPVAEAYAPVRDLRKAIFFGGLLVAIMFSMVGALLARRMSTPLRLIAESAANIERGSGHAVWLPGKTYREVETLTAALNSLLAKLVANDASLRELNQTLESRVAARTHELADSRERLLTLANNIPAVIVYVDDQERYQFVNQTYEDWFGRHHADVYGKTMAECHGEQQYNRLAPQIHRVLQGQHVKFDEEIRTVERMRHLEISYIPHVDEDGRVVGFYAMANDITARKLHESELHELATRDTLTGLPNRRACLVRLEEAVGRVERSGKALALLFLDLDKFKSINDEHGHATGDAALLAFAHRLKNSVRKTDMVARLAGDEFVVIAEGLTHAAEDAVNLAEKIISSLAAPIDCGDVAVIASTSIGIALHRQGTASAESLLERADNGMYKAKRKGTNRYYLTS